jgi:rod shape-determining protein MreD
LSYFRTAALFFVAIVAHWWWSSYFSFSGLSPQLLLVLTVVAAAKLGPNAAMTFGFFWGLFLDVFAAHLFGANALALTLVGYGVGVARKQVDVSGFAPLSAMILAMTWAYFLLLSLLGLVFLRSFAWVGWAPFLVDPIYNCLLLPFGNWAWSAALGEERFRGARA